MSANIGIVRGQESNLLADYDGMPPYAPLHHLPFRPGIHILGASPGRLSASH
jgi:hypothetical protein